MRAGSGIGIGASGAFGANRIYVHGVRQHNQTLSWNLKLFAQLLCHCEGLADHTMRMAVKHSIKEARVPWEVAKSQSSCNGPILPHHDACSSRKKAAQKQDEKVEVEHPREDYVRFDLSNESMQPEGSSPHSRCSQAVNRD